MTKKLKLFRNQTVDKKNLKKILLWGFHEFGKLKACALSDHLKTLGFFYSTQAGVSLSIEDLRVPPTKTSLVRIANDKMKDIVRKTDTGEITEVERFQKIINLWNRTSETLKTRIINFLKKNDPLNPIYMMAFSGARGNISQVRQLVGMRGLMSDPSGEIIDLPISSNFREGLTIADYIISAYGARKGLVDTSLKTADSGYLTRRLIDVGQDVIVKEADCKTNMGIKIILFYNGLEVNDEQNLIGRVIAKPIYNPITNNLIANINEEITSNLEKHIKNLKISHLYIRSPLTCISSRSICQICYGWDLSSENLIQLGEAVGILAAQSIGEPGTQLTMRTFHTGGVFTSEERSRQISSKVAGQVFFSNNLPLELKLTKYAELLPRTKNLGKMFVVDYLNQVHIVSIFENTIVLISDKTYVQEDEPIMELPSKKTGDQKTIKYISANHSGEIIFKKNPSHYLNLKTTNNLIWILYGQRYSIPIQSKITIKPLLQISKYTSLASTKIINLTAGIISCSKPIINYHLTSFDILQHLTTLNDLKIYLEKKENLNKSLTIYISTYNRIKLKFVNSENILRTFTPIGYLENLTHYLKTGGILCFLNYRLKKKPFSVNQNELKKGCTIFYIPENNYKINKDKKGLKVKMGDFINSSKEIFTDIFTPFAGTIVLNKSNKIIETIKIKPGKQILLNNTENYQQYHQQIYYPGEIIFNDYIIEQLSYGELIQTSNHNILLLRPLIRYELVKTKINYSKFLFTKNSNLELKINGFELEIPVRNFTKILNSINLFKRLLMIRPKIRTANLNTRMKLKISNQNYAQIQITSNENIYIEQTIPKEIEKIKGFFINLIEDKQIIEPYTILATLNLLNSQNLEFQSLYSIKQLSKKTNREILLLTNLDYDSIYFEDKDIFRKANSFLKKGEKIGKNLISSKSGIILNSFGNKILLRFAQPYLFSEGANIKKKSGFVNENQQLGKIIYERARTDDIVQGLPKIEEFLEARKPKTNLIINAHPGLVQSFKINFKIKLWIGYQKKKCETDKISQEASNFYSFDSPTKRFIQKFQFINIAQPLNEDIPINPHLILTTYFNYYKSLYFFSKQESAYRSFKKVQALLLQSVQNIYHSQGVYIADKHLEMIIRKMTMKVEVLSSGDTALLRDELIDLDKIDYINRCLKSEKKADYQPVLLGITKASLKTDSFISAASFQETTKVLTEAAIYGKTDWLQGLKENVIVGRLIPVGTGFNLYNDVSHRLLRIPSSKENKIKLLEIKESQIKYKYSKIKNKIKFKALI